MAAQPPSASRSARSPDRAGPYDQHGSMQQYYSESSARRYANGLTSARDAPANGVVPSPPIRSPTTSRSGYFGYEGLGERSLSGDHSPGSMNQPWNQAWPGNNYDSRDPRAGYDPEGRRYPSPPLHRSSIRSPRSSSNPTMSDTHHHHRYPSSSHHEDPLLSPTRSSTYPGYMHSESRVRRSSSSGAPLNGSVRDEPHHSQLSPPSKSVAIPSHTNVSQDGQYASTPRSGAMSISSLLTTEAPPSPPVTTVTPSSRHSNIVLTASSSRPQRRKPSMDAPPPPMSSISLSATKKRKREGDAIDEESRSGANGRLPKIKFRSSAMSSAETDESDGTDDTEFVQEREKYFQAREERTQDLLKAEEERINQFKNVVNDVVVRRLERRMKTARHRAYQIHYEASMAKVLQEEARKKEAAREAKKNKKRKLLPVVEDPVVKIDRKKGKGKKKPTSTTTAEGEEVGHTGFVIKLKGNLKPDDSMELDDVDSARRHSFLAGRPTPKFLPALPQPPPGEQLTPSDLRAYDRLVKATERRFDQFISSVWKDIAKKDIAKAYRQMDLSLKAKQSNAKKTVQLAAKEARRWQARSTKASKEMQIKSKKAMREMLYFWRKNEREERDLRKKAEKEAIDRAKREEELREARRQARKLNFLITQTELYSHFVGKKVNGMGGEESSANGDIPQASPIPSGDSSGQGPDKFEDLDFDADDDEALRAAAARSAQNAVQLAQNKAKDFDLATRPDAKPAATAAPVGDIDMKDIDIDAEDLNFTNPTGMADIEQIPQPKMLNCQLKEYQLKGLNWLVNLYEQGINGILADEMGLGKTVQSISVMAYLAETHNVWGPFLVIAPASTLHNWQQEISRFVPGLKALPYWGNAKDRKVLRKFWNRKHVTYTQDAPFHVLITSYQLVVQDEKYFQKIKWQYMILDEAQAIKSSSSSRWKILLGLHCRNRLLLTGTPIQNTMQELWALLHFIMPTLFDSHEEFSEWFSKDIESHTQSNTKLNQQQLRRLHMILKPFMLRRNKKDVQSELPAKVELDIYCNLSYRQRAYYKTLRERISIGDLLERAMSGEAKGDESLMNLVMQFRKVCNHPDLFERADVRSPLAFASFGATGNIAREGPQMSLAYTTKNRITYDVPKLVYRHGGMLSVPSEDSSNGTRLKYLDHLMNIWQSDYIESSASLNHSAFGFLRFVNASSSDIAKAFKGNNISDTLAVIDKANRQAISKAVYDDDGDGYNPKHSMLLVPRTVNRVPLKEVTNEKVMQHLCNVADDTFRSERLHIMDPMYDIPVFAPPVDISCSDRTFVVGQNDALFDDQSRRALFGISPLEEARLAETGESIDTGLIPPQGLLGPAVLERSGYSGIRVPEMHRFVTDSGKLATLDRLLSELKAGGHRVLLYFQMTRMMDLIEEYLAYRQYKYLRLDGSSKIGDRRDMVADWQTRQDLFVFVLSTRAGGLGINLTAADTVIFYDSDWNPTVDSQAMDRAHRLGQTKQVTVYRLITRNSIEERILLRAKQKEEVQRVVISGNAFKDTEVDFNKGNSRDVVSWLLDDDELEEQLRFTQARREAEEAEAIRNGTKKKARGGKKPRIGIGSLESPAASRTLEDMYHEGEGNFEDASARASGTATPASGVEPGPLLKKSRSKAGDTHKTALKRSHKRRSAAQAISYLDAESGDVEMAQA